MSEEILEPVTFARIEGGRVVNLELWAQPPEVDGVLFVASTSARIGDAYDHVTGAIETPVPAFDLESLRLAALDELAAQRWAATQTFAYDGVRAPADPALNAVVGFVVGSQLSPPSGPINWELVRGVWRTWTLAQIIDYGLAIRTHIQNCFDRAAELTDQVSAAATPAAIAAIIEDARTSWPS